MQQVIKITEEDIQYTERILLPEGKFFDDERRTFIKNLETLDLQAVPGSGKTTVLLAKLLILEKKLPFEDGSGILVISHTNAAIDEIKSRIQKHCPKLFSYPNFIGTIQSFVDTYLAIPYFTNKTGNKLLRIDGVSYDEISEILFRYNLSGYSSQEQANARYLIKSQEILNKYRFGFIDGKFEILTEINGKPLSIQKPKRKNQKKWVDFTAIEKMKIATWLIDFKKRIWNEGIIHYDDAYYFAETYIMRFPMIIDIIQMRFSYVLVDEMQDMDKHQYDILEKLFYNEEEKHPVFQRIGDKNQSIFNGIVKIDEIWVDRKTILHINGSQRLSAEIANIVDRFALHRPAGFKIVGENANGFKPIILKYNSNTISNIIPIFKSIISQLDAHPDNSNFSQRLRQKNDNGSFKFPIKIIAWVAKEKPEITLRTYYSNFSDKLHKPKIDYEFLNEYLINYDKQLNTLSSIRKNILNAFLKILRLESVLDSKGKLHTISSLLERLKTFDEDNENRNEVFLLNIYNWTLGIIKGNMGEILNQIRIYIPDFLQIFGKEIRNSKDFIESEDKNSTELTETKTEHSNIIKFSDLEAEVTTIHSVKGQTHSATLFLESFYQGKYESERLFNQFLGNPFNETKVYHKESTKMAYVGLSRATDLLCVAIHEDRFEKHLSKIDNDVWQIIDV